MQGNCAQEGDAVDIPEMDLAREQEERGEEEAEQNRAGEVAVVHDVLVDGGKGVKDCEGLEW